MGRECSDRTRSNVFKMKESRFKFGIKKKFFTVRVVRPWHRLPREAVAAPSPSVCSGLAAAGNKSATQPPLPPPGCGGEWEETGRNRWVRIRAV